LIFQGYQAQSEVEEIVVIVVTPPSPVQLSAAAVATLTAG